MIQLQYIVDNKYITSYNKLGENVTFELAFWEVDVDSVSTGPTQQTSELWLPVSSPAWRCGRPDEPAAFC